MDIVTARGLAVNDLFGVRREICKANWAVPFDGFAVGVQIFVFGIRCQAGYWQRCCCEDFSELMRKESKLIL